MIDSITRENRLSILLALATRNHNSKMDIFYHQDIQFYKAILDEGHLIDSLLVDDDKTIPGELLSAGKELLLS